MMYEENRPSDNRSLGELFAELTREVTTLVRQEAQLAKAELTAKARSIGKDVAFVAAGGAVAYAGFLALVAAVVLMLVRLGMPAWGAALLVSLIVMGLGAYLAVQGLNALKREDLKPQETIDSLNSLKEDVSGTQHIRSRAAGPG
jgi:hypothetical protein